MIKIASARSLSDEIGWVDVYVDRRSILGNPFRMTHESLRDLVCQAYRKWLWQCLSQGKSEPNAIAIESNLTLANTYKYPSASEVKEELMRIGAIAQTSNVRLICWCHPKQCHADVILKCLTYLATQSA